MKTRSIASSLVTMSLGALLSACGGAELSDGSDAYDGAPAGDALSDIQEVSQQITACDDNQYDHWRYLSALAVAAANELGRWDISDFVKNGNNIKLSPTGLARCKNGCDNVQAILSMQDDATKVVPRHDPPLLRQYMVAFYDRQVNWNRTNPVPEHKLKLVAVSDDVCGLRYHFDVESEGSSSTSTTTNTSTNTNTSTTTSTGLSGTTEIKPTSQYKCLDIASSGQHDGAGVQQYNCSGQANQKFTIEHQGNNQYRIKANHSGKCLSVVNNANYDGANLEQRTCGSSNSQLFQLNSKGNQLYEIRNVNSGKCIDIKSYGYGDGQGAQIYNCSNGANQIFQMQSLSSGGTGGGSNPPPPPPPGPGPKPKPKPQTLWSHLKFAGEHENRYLMFQATDSQVSIDPMATLISGGSSSSSGACVETGTTMPVANGTIGHCCMVKTSSGMKQGKITAIPNNTRMLMCKY
jgi:hypothetical protein